MCEIINRRERRRRENMIMRWATVDTRHKVEPDIEVPEDATSVSQMLSMI